MIRGLPVEQASCLVEHGMCVFYPSCKHGSRQTMRDARGWRGSFVPGSVVRDARVDDAVIVLLLILNLG